MPGSGSFDPHADDGDMVQLKNVLSQSRSPYVRGHMNNPVAWQMWSPEAIELAKKTNKLLFVSIGYAACHWCHVMERESFENADVAALLNAHFIPVKVDREERPDVDRIYMNYVQANTGHGGWPLNVFLTPDLEPVFGGTYWPGPGSQSARLPGYVGFLDILERVKTVWKTQQQRCLESASTVTERLREFAMDGNHGGSLRTSFDGDDESDGLELELLDEAYEHFAGKYDSVHGGLGGAPKFPTPANLSFLLHLGQFPEVVQDVVGAKECENAKAMVLTTLRNMARGGIKDQVGNGFARYSVTKDWSLPHFEKMLYDQGQLLDVYVDAFLVTGDAEMLGAVYDIATYLTTFPIAAPNGGFFSSEDADSRFRPEDSEKREGAFYVWTKKEFRSILGDRDAAILAKFYNVQEYGNVDREHDAHDELTNQNVLAIATTPEALAKQFGLDIKEVVNILKTAKQKLLEHRNKERPRPALDDKIVVAWNGLAIGALARASSIIHSIDAEKAQTFLNSAIKAVAFIKAELFDPKTSTLKRVYREGPGDAPGFADDYAFLIAGLIDLYEATFDDSHLEFADTLQKTQNTLFHDASHGAFFSTLSAQPDMLLRLKDGMDAAEPSTNGVSALNLYRLGSLLSDASYTALARRTVAAFATEIGQHPFLFASMLASVVAGQVGMRSVVFVGDGVEVEEAVRRGRLRLGVCVNTTVSRVGGGVGVGCRWLKGRNALLGEFGDQGRIQVCAEGVCRDVVELGDVERALRRVGV